MSQTAPVANDQGKTVRVYGFVFRFTVWCRQTPIAGAAGAATPHSQKSKTAPAATLLVISATAVPINSCSESLQGKHQHICAYP
jgi:hypothetical protein